MDAFDGLLRDALTTTAAVALPVLAVSAAVGTAVAVLQAATQVQEQTLTLLPKVLAVGATVGIFGAFAMHLLAGLFTRAIAVLPALAGS
ncbi:MAG TPA: flagellar biosynthetic protein FliQ [Candidatus Acidoferrales bacterium]|nr:flagellar biosynthetic protein FliQ [Candidatus Acidoferrales bacterium]